MANLKDFMVSALDGEWQVVLEVDLDKLTVERAREHNLFWSGADFRVAAEDGDVVKAAVRNFGTRAIREIASDGGDWFGDGTHSKHYTDQIHEEEGFGGGDGTPHGWIGIRIVSAEVNVPGFNDCELSEGRRA